MLKNIKVMTYNICHCMDYTDSTIRDFWNIYPEKTTQVVKSINADMVGLNEVFNEGEEPLINQAGKIASYDKNLNYCFAEAIKFEKIRSYGNAFLSKFPILEMQKFKVFAPTPEERRPDENSYYEDRIVLRAVVDMGKPVTVFVTHFGLNKQEVERMVDVLIKCLDDEKNPHILMGDFNVEPDNDLIKPIFARMRSVAKECGNTQKTFATYEDQLQIDYIFVSKEFNIKSFERVNTNVSDHYPCVAELEINLD